MVGDASTVVQSIALAVVAATQTILVLYVKGHFDTLKDGTLQNPALDLSAPVDPPIRPDLEV